MLPICFLKGPGWRVVIFFLIDSLIAAKVALNQMKNILNKQHIWALDMSQKPEFNPSVPSTRTLWHVCMYEFMCAHTHTYTHIHIHTNDEKLKLIF